MLDQSPDLVGTVLPGVAENDNDDLRSLLRWVADQPERPNVEIVCAHENSPVAGRKDAISYASRVVQLSCRLPPIWNWPRAESPN